MSGTGQRGAATCTYYIDNCKKSESLQTDGRQMLNLFNPRMRLLASSISETGG